MLENIKYDTTVCFSEISSILIYDEKKEVVHMDVVKICCKKCSKRLFDYVSGSTEMNMKCERCKRIIRFKNFNEVQIRENIQDGVFKI